MYNKPGRFHYRIAQAASWLVSKVLYRNKVLRNEIKHQDGPFVVIANHQTALDFVNLICATSRPMSFVISRSFFTTLPIKGFLNKMGVIPKQQFQTTVKDMKQMKSVIDNGQPLVIYPAGLMCEDGLSTPIPAATYKFLKWLDVDVYVARSYGSYFVMPKWTSGVRPGRTYIDIYKLFSKEDLRSVSIQELKAATDEALLFDAYREQEKFNANYIKNDNIGGLEHVLYKCPNCGEEFTMVNQQPNSLCCSACGYRAQSDAYGFLHNDIGPEIRYVSDWSKWIFSQLKEEIQRNPEYSLSVQTKFKLVNEKTSKFEEAGEGELTLSASGFSLNGTLNGAPFELNTPVGGIPTLPFSPGKYLEIQNGKDIYRCVLEDGKLVMKFINLVKIFYELHAEEVCHTTSNV
jgi:hypothetical protein